MTTQTASRRLVIVLFALAGATSRASAQIPLRPSVAPHNQQIRCGSFDNPATPLTGLRDDYLAGQWSQLQNDTIGLLARCAFEGEPSDPNLFPSKGKPDVSRDWYEIVLATVDTNDEPLILRYVVHTPQPYPYATSVLGVPVSGRDVKGEQDTGPRTPRLVQVFFSPHPALSLQTQIQATETPNPVTEQIADVVKAIADPAVVLPLLKGVVAPAAGFAAPARSAAPVLATVARINLPFARGDYKYSDVLRVEPVLDGDRNIQLRAQVDAISDAEVRAADAAEKAGGASAAMLRAEADMAVALAAAGRTYLTTRENVVACSSSGYQPACWTRLGTVVDEAKTTFCLPASRQVFCQSDRAALLLIKFQQAVKAPKSVTTSASTAMTAIPLQRLSFGVVSAYIAGAKTTSDRVKVDGGKVTADPLGRALNAVVLNVHPAFNPKAPAMETGERLRGFVGGVITPSLGVTVGGGVGLLRNLSVNAGYALLWIPTLRSGDTLNAAPSDGKRPFRSAAAHAGYIGMGYKFGK